MYRVFISTYRLIHRRDRFVYDNSVTSRSIYTSQSLITSIQPSSGLHDIQFRGNTYTFLLHYESKVAVYGGGEVFKRVRILLISDSSQCFVILIREERVSELTAQTVASFISCRNH